MPTVQIRNVSESIYQRLRVRAKAEHRSIQREAAWLLEQALRVLPAVTPEERWVEARAIQEEMRQKYGTLPDSTADIRQARDAR